VPHIKCMQSVILICFTCSNDHGILPEDYWITVRVDPTVELFCTIHRLAETGVDDTQELPNYIRDIENYFTPIRYVFNQWVCKQ